MYYDKVEQSKLDRAVYQAFASTPEGLNPEEQRRHLLSKMPAGFPGGIVAWAKTLTSMWPGAKMGSQAGKQMQDRATLVQQYGEDSPQVKQFDEQVNKGKDKTEMKTIYGPGGETKEVPVKKGEEFDPVKAYGQGWSLAKPSEGYKTRRIQQGTQEVDQESHDGGKTWTTIGGGPKFKPRQVGEETPQQKKEEKKTTARNREIDRIDTVMKTEETLAVGNAGKMALVDKKKEYMNDLLKSGKADTVEDAKIQMKKDFKDGVPIDDETRLKYLKANGNNVKKAKAAAEADGWRI
jgi:hypothetical protein